MHHHIGALKNCDHSVKILQIGFDIAFPWVEGAKAIRQIGRDQVIADFAKRFAQVRAKAARCTGENKFFHAGCPCVFVGGGAVLGLDDRGFPKGAVFKNARIAERG